MQEDTHNQFSPITIALHWIIALAIIGLLGSGLYMTQNQIYALYPWHKSFGTIIAAFVIMRVLWRMYNGWPTDLPSHQTWERILAKAVHYVLIISTVMMPLSGMAMSALGGAWNPSLWAGFHQQSKFTRSTRNHDPHQ